MALQKSIDTSFGVPAFYWRIVEAHEIFGQCVHVKLFGYPDKARRDADKACLAAQTITLEGKDYKQDMTRESMYFALKGYPDFDGALDV